MNLEDLKVSVLAQIDRAKTAQDLTNLRVSLLGKNGHITAAFAGMREISDKEEKKAFGASLNEIKNLAEHRIDSLFKTFYEDEVNENLKTEQVDITMPSRKISDPKIHLLTRTLEEIKQIFVSKFGFEIADGPEIETDFYNFTALNVPKNHPAREMQDTFYLKNLTDANGLKMLLRTQTSSVQIRNMMGQKPPFRFISTGRVYRSDFDKTHTPMFSQVEGVCMDKNITMGHLKYVLDVFLKSFFEKSEIEIRLRPSFFPFTEPSAEVDIGYRAKDGSVKYLEVMGCGMIHKNVLKTCGIEEGYQGFAFGMGLERLTMLKYGVLDLREFFESDINWLSWASL